MSEHLVDIADERATYQMQSWSHADACTCPIPHDGHLPKCPYPTTRHYWMPMENGAAKARWKPKADVRGAVKQAARWAGAVIGLGIPAMQVVELPSGSVVWRDSARYPSAGEPVAPPWQAEAYAEAIAEQRTEDGEDAATPPVAVDSTTQAVLF